MKFLLLYILLRSLPVLASDMGRTALDQPFTSSFIKLQHAPCVTLYHRNGRVGCGTAESDSNQEGMLAYFDGSLPQTQEKPYVAVIEDYYLTLQSFQTLLADRGGRLRGIIVLNSTSSDHKFYSPDSVYPQGYGTPSQDLQYGNYQYKWNPNGQDLFALDLYSVPMAFVSDIEVSSSLRQESQFNMQQLETNEDHIVASFNYYMGGDSVDSIKCLEWKDVDGTWAPKCLPLGGNSVWATAGSPPNPNKNSSPRPVVLLAGSMDSASLFHDVTPGANTAASNILTLLMAAKLLGTYVSDDVFDSLSSRIILAFFQGESYGFVGSRSFLKDLSSFQCGGSLVHSIARLGDKSEYACLNPLRPSMAFANLGKVQGMISVDQIAQQVGDGVLYVHADQNNDNMGKFLAETLIYSKTSSVSVAAASVNSDNGKYPYPPTPLTSLLHITQGGVGGAVVTGFDYVFSNKVPFNSMSDSAFYQSVNLKPIAAAATIVARAMLAAAYDGGNSFDAQTAAQYAANLIPEMTYQDESLVELANCFFYNGDCSLIQKHAQAEANSDRTRTGIAGLSVGNPLGVPPNYYVGVYTSSYGQPFVQVGEKWYGAYNGQDYGKKDSDAVGLIPRQLEAALHGLLNDFMGRGSVGGENDLVKCSKFADCAGVEYCQSFGEYAVCTGGGYCVCKRAHYHVALDEALKPAVDKDVGFFEVKDNEAGVSPIYAEPYWSNDVSVRVYRSVGWLPGFFVFVSGVLASGASLFASFVLKVGLKKEKLY
jgi:nicastrin